AELFGELLEEGKRTGAFQVQHIPLIAACLVGAIAEALVGSLSPPAWAAREAARPSLALAEVSQTLITFCLRAVGAPLPAEELPS
ncbi:MAG: TetR/AcrR family transcriptional regulator, partial [Pseudomonas sp.]